MLPDLLTRAVRADGLCCVKSGEVRSESGGSTQTELMCALLPSPSAHWVGSIWGCRCHTDVAEDRALPQHVGPPEPAALFVFSCFVLLLL